MSRGAMVVRLLGVSEGANVAFAVEETGQPASRVEVSVCRMVYVVEMIRVIRVVSLSLSAGVTVASASRRFFGVARGPQ